jgi:putative flippase GtrA
VTLESPTRISLVKRWLRFNLVGLLGILVQFTALTALTHLGLPYLWATGVAVESAVLHNWIWHERYTWSDRNTGGANQRLARLAKFNLSNGAVSLLGNLVLMKLLFGHLHVPLLISNLTSIILCSLINFVLGDRFVFGTGCGLPGLATMRSKSCLP